MTEEKKGKRPDYKGDGIAVWVNKTKEGKTFLNVSLLGGAIRLPAWKNEPRKEEAAL